MNITFAYLVREVEPKEIDTVVAKLNGTYVPEPGEKPPPRQGKMKVSASDLSALDSLKARPNPPTM